MQDLGRWRRDVLGVHSIILILKCERGDGEGLGGVGAGGHIELVAHQAAALLLQDLHKRLERRAQLRIEGHIRPQRVVCSHPPHQCEMLCRVEASQTPRPRSVTCPAL